MKKRVKIKKKRVIKIFFVLIVLILLSLFIIRLISPRELDDVSPQINCPELEKYNPNILYIIPDYNGNPISENKDWCDYILSLNKTLCLHGIQHSPYREFIYKDITQEELNFAISEFEKCFGYSPSIFKAPQLRITKENRELIKKNNMAVETQFSQVIHKSYHCNNAGNLDNRIINLI